MNVFCHSILIYSLLFGFVYSSFAQITDSDVILNDTTIILNEVILHSNVQNDYSVIQFMRLKRKVLKTYRYVDSIRSILTELDTSVHAFTSKRSLRRYYRLKNKEIKKKFVEEISSLTRSEGKILSKMIYREFGVTAYSIISKYRGGLRARFWHNIAKIYDGNLKVEFDTINIQEDAMINQIILNHIK